jgi:hypothetical protein
MGFNVAAVKVVGAKFFVEGDIMFNRVDLQALHARKYQTPQRTSISQQTPPEGIRPFHSGLKNQWIGGSGTASNSGAHVVDLSGISDRPTWVQAARSAMAEWNAIPGAVINWQEGSGPGSVRVIHGNCNYNDPSVWACSGPPIQGTLGDTIAINNVGGFAGLNPAEQEFTLVHELGHTLGFRHSNWQSLHEQQFGARLVENTPASDASSVMNGGAMQEWHGFSQYDQYAASLYFNPPDFPVTYSANGPTASWAPQPQVVYYHAIYTYVTWPRDEYGTPSYHQDYIDLGTTYDTSIAIQDQDTGDNQCGNGVYVQGFYPSGASNGGWVNTATCSSANYP